MQTYIWEDNSGGIYAVVILHGETISIVDLTQEHYFISPGECIEEARSGFIDADAYDPDHFNGQDMESVQKELERNCELIAEITWNTAILHMDVMGSAGKRLFGIL